jgi:hypothetical protein
MILYHMAKEPKIKIPKPLSESKAERRELEQSLKEYQCYLGPRLESAARIRATENREHICTLVRKAVKKYLSS